MKRIGIAGFCLIIVMCGQSFAEATDERQLPEGYVSDRCTAFPDGNYGDCCIAHDKDYFFGGTRAERKASDKRLKQCVLSKGGGWKRRLLANTMYLGVRLGGIGVGKGPFSWGFGKRYKKPN